MVLSISSYENKNSALICKQLQSCYQGRVIHFQHSINYWLPQLQHPVVPQWLHNFNQPKHIVGKCKTRMCLEKGSSSDGTAGIASKRKRLVKMRCESFDHNLYITIYISTNDQCTTVKLGLHATYSFACVLQSVLSVIADRAQDSSRSLVHNQIDGYWDT